MMTIIYLFNFLFAIWLLRKLLMYFDKIDNRYEAEEKMEEIKEKNILVSNIREFKNEYNTLDKTKEIKKFIQGE